MTVKGTHGGRRPGAGRKPGHGKYREPTRTLRVPLSLVETVQRMAEHRGPAADARRVPLYASPVAAGHPAFADDAVEERVDLTERLIRDPEATFLVRARGESMIGAGIQSGDLLVVDRGLAPANGRIVIALVDGEATVKRVRLEGGRLWLLPANPEFPPLKVSQADGLVILGVVTNVIHAV
jgi:DNA polymerase V